MPKSLFIRSLGMIAALALTGCGTPDASPSDTPAAGLGPWGVRIGNQLSTAVECRANPADILEPGGKFVRPTGAAAGTHEFAGRCVDAHQFRPAVALTGQFAAPYGFPPSPDHLVVANVGELGTFYVARIPLNAIAETRYLMEQFGFGPAVHAMVRFTFSQDVVLRRQFPASSGDAFTTRELALSVHATGPAGVGYSATGPGLSDSFAVVWGLFTLRDKIAGPLLKQQHPIDQLALALSPAQARKLLETYVAQAPERFFSTSYNTLNRNCGTEQFYAMHKALGLPPPKQVGESILGVLVNILRNGGIRSAIPDIAPAYAHEALKERRLIRDVESAARPTLADDPTVQGIISSLR